jgi:NADH:ubiquinone oxidoreductase subunit E
MELTPDNKARFEEILKRYPVKRSALLPTLHLTQEQEGWLSREAIEHVAALLDLTPAQVHDTASFYTMFRLKPAGTPAASSASSRGAPPQTAGSRSGRSSASPRAAAPPRCR